MVGIIVDGNVVGQGLRAMTAASATRANERMEKARLGENRRQFDAQMQYYRDQLAEQAATNAEKLKISGKLADTQQYIAETGRMDAQTRAADQGLRELSVNNQIRTQLLAEHEAYENKVLDQIEMELANGATLAEAIKANSLSFAAAVNNDPKLQEVMERNGITEFTLSPNQETAVFDEEGKPKTSGLTLSGVDAEGNLVQLKGADGKNIDLDLERVYRTILVNTGRRDVSGLVEDNFNERVEEMGVAPGPGARAELISRRIAPKAERIKEERGVAGAVNEALAGAGLRIMKSPEQAARDEATTEVDQQLEQTRRRSLRDTRKQIETERDLNRYGPQGATARANIRSGATTAAAETAAAQAKGQQIIAENQLDTIRNQEFGKRVKEIGDEISQILNEVTINEVGFDFGDIDIYQADTPEQVSGKIQEDVFQTINNNIADFAAVLDVPEDFNEWNKAQVRRAAQIVALARQEDGDTANLGKIDRDTIKKYRDTGLTASKSSLAKILTLLSGPAAATTDLYVK